jgi:hypothetical protein
LSLSITTFRMHSTSFTCFCITHHVGIPPLLLFRKTHKSHPQYHHSVGSHKIHRDSLSSWIPLKIKPLVLNSPELAIRLSIPHAAGAKIWGMGWRRSAHKTLLGNATCKNRTILRTRCPTRARVCTPNSLSLWCFPCEPSS